jgi:aromatic-L-amino-acid decarboxylase
MTHESLDRPQTSDSPSVAERRAAAYRLEETEAVLRKMTNWLRTYWTQPEHWPVYQPGQTGDTYRQIAPEMPTKGQPLDEVFCAFQQTVLPRLLHWNHPGFFGFFPSNTSGPSVAASLLTASLNVNPFSWNAGPGAVELEARVVEWLGAAIGLPWPGCLQDTASSSTLCAVIAARERALARFPEAQEEGLRAAPPLAAYLSEEAHSSVEKALLLAGIGGAYIHKIPTSDHLGIDANALHAAILADHSRGRIPFFVCSSLGTTSSTAFDDVHAVQSAIEQTRPAAKYTHTIWHHVDAALAGSAAILPEQRWMMNGVKEADSFVFNPHKWLFTHFECSALFVRDKETYKAALRSDPAYLQNHTEKSDDDSNGYSPEDYRNWSIQLGRGFRGLKLWFVLSTYGLDGIQKLLRHHLQLTQHLYKLLADDRRFVVLSPPRLNTICIACPKGDHDTRQLYERIIQRKRVYLTPTVIRDRFWIRIAIGQTAVQIEDVESLYSELIDTVTGRSRQEA